MSNCRNPECRNGLTPGVVIAGKGNAKMPVLGQTQRWGWVRCLACNPPERASQHGVTYKHVERSAEEIARRAELATNKAPYKPESAVAKSLGSLKVNGHTPVSPPAPTADMTKLLDQITKLTEQVSQLTTLMTNLSVENARLREQLAAKPEAPKPS